MSLIYIFRHGQAGTRDDYDRLSELGRQQAVVLGEWIRKEHLQFDKVLCGGLRRQVETAELALSGGSYETDPRWAEFDLDAVYAEVAPQLAADDATFRAHWEELQSKLESGNAEIHRQWAPADMGVVEAWIAGRYATKTESWQQFTARVLDAVSEFTPLKDGQKVAIFTSATPMSISVAEVLGLADPWKIMGFAGAAMNTGISVLHGRHGQLNLFQFNATPHLVDPRLRTFR